MLDLRRRTALRHLVWCVALAVGVTASAGSAVASSHPSSTESAQPAWTVMVYISGDNNLEKFVVNDLEDELGAVGVERSRFRWSPSLTAGLGSTPDAATGRPPSSSTSPRTCARMRRVAVADWGERNMGSPRTLTRFVQWTKTNYPADHYAMYFWGHGWNWHPGWVLEDDTNDDTLDVDEARDVIPSLGDFDVVGYDGCNMASIEIMDLWHGHARAVTGSQEWVGWDGLEYDVFLEQLQDDPGMSARQLAIASSASTTTEKTWSAVDVGSRLDTLLDAVDAWSRALKRAVPDHRAALRAAFDKTRSYWQAKMDKDLYDLAKTINGHVQDREVRATGRDVMRAVRAVVLHEHHAENKAGSHGITIYGPGTERQRTDHRYYRSLDFAKDTHWDEFLDAFH